jgi:predicted nucleic acid-binding protein
VDIAISNTSPLLYLYRIGGLAWLTRLFTEVWVPDAVIAELEAGRQRGYDVPVIERYPWIKHVNPRHVPEEWLVLDLGPGELVTLALAFEHREQVVLLDDLLARRIAQAAGLQVWGTLRVLLEAKAQSMIPEVAPYVNKLVQAGMWVSEDIRRRILRLAGETA